MSPAYHMSSCEVTALNGLRHKFGDFFEPLSTNDYLLTLVEHGFEVKLETDSQLREQTICVKMFWESKCSE